MTFHHRLKRLMAAMNAFVSVQMAIFSVQLCIFFAISVTTFLTPGKVAIYITLLLMIEMAVYLIIIANGTENVRTTYIMGLLLNLREQCL